MEEKTEDCQCGCNSEHTGCKTECQCTPECSGKCGGPDGCGSECPDTCQAGQNCDPDSDYTNCISGGPPDLDWIPIPGGTYQMGSDAGDTTEQPVHSVTVPAFEMTKTEVTIDQYQACVDAEACTLPDDYTVSSYCNWGGSGRGLHPVDCVDWNQAVAFCSWAGGRLPSESEWEYAARSAGQDITYPWGDETATCQYAVMDDGGVGCGQDSTWAVCGKPAGNTVQGLCNMSGNVIEWVQDVYHFNYFNAPADGSAWEDSGSIRVMRGGSFYYGEADGMTATTRTNNVPSDRDGVLGFRCAR